MSSYEFKAKNKETGEEAIVYARDDHFGRHRYGYMIEGNVAMTEDQFNQCWERIEVTPEKETPTQSRSDTFGHSTTLKETPTPKTVEEVVAEFKGLKPPDDNNDVDGWERLDNWLRTTLTAQNQVADERLREVLKEILSEATFAEFTPYDTSKATRIEDIETIAAKHGITNL